MLTSMPVWYQAVTLALILLAGPGVVVYGAVDCWRWGGRT
jgi:hypothetical protein